MIEILVHAKPMDTLPETGEVFAEKRNLHGDRQLVMLNCERIRNSFDNYVAWSYEKYQNLDEELKSPTGKLVAIAKAAVEVATSEQAQKKQHVEPPLTLPSFQKILMTNIEIAVRMAQPRVHWSGAQMAQIVIPAWHEAVDEYEKIVAKAASEGVGDDESQTGDGSNADQT